jgi:hypothetical protein
MGVETITCAPSRRAAGRVAGQQVDEQSKPEPPSTNPSAAEEVLRTTELLEMILSQLNARDFLSAQRVSYLWSRVIATHKPILRNRYLLQDCFTAPPLCTDRSTKWSPQDPQVNPLFIQRFLQSAAYHVLYTLNPSVTFHGTDPLVLSHHSTFANPSATWRSMLLYNPPVKKAWLRPMSARFEDVPQLLIARDGAEGLMLGDVVEMFEGLVKGDSSGWYVHILSWTVTRKVMWMLSPA